MVRKAGVNLDSGMLPVPRMNTNDSALWTEGDWRCELRAGPAGTGRLVVYKSDQVITAEATILGAMAQYRAEILRQRVVRGDLRAPE